MQTKKQPKFKIGDNVKVLPKYESTPYWAKVVALFDESEEAYRVLAYSSQTPDYATEREMTYLSPREVRQYELASDYYFGDNPIAFYIRRNIEYFRVGCKRFTQEEAEFLQKLVNADAHIALENVVIHRYMLSGIVNAFKLPKPKKVEVKSKQTRKSTKTNNRKS